MGMVHGSNRQLATGTVLIVGCGKVGSRLGDQLVQAGTQVFALRRETQGLPSAFTTLAIDLLEPIRKELPAVDSMVITLTPGMHDSVGNSGYLTALRHLAQALPNVPPRVVFVSSTRVFEGHTEDCLLTERDDVAPVSQRGQILVDGERLAAELFNAHIVRPAGIYGPGRDMLLRKVFQQEPVQHAKRTNRIHEADLVRALHYMLTPDAPPTVVHAVDRAPGSLLGDVVTHIADRLGVAPPPAGQPTKTSGRTLSGGLLGDLLGSLEYPTYVEGYDQILKARAETGAS